MPDGTIVSLMRCPVKSIMGEELNRCDVTEAGLLGDRSLALVDVATGNVVSAKNPKKWPGMFDFRALFTSPPELRAVLPAVRGTLPDGSSITTRSTRFAEIMSNAHARQDTLVTGPSPHPTREQHRP